MGRHQEPFLECSWGQGKSTGRPSLGNGWHEGQADALALPSFPRARPTTPESVPSPCPPPQLTDAAAAGGVEDVALVADTGKAPTGVGAVPVVAKATLLALIHIWGRKERRVSP